MRPIRVPAVWEFTPDTLGDRWEALCHRSRVWQAVNAIGIVLILMAGIVAVAFTAVSVAVRIGGGK